MTDSATIEIVSDLPGVVQRQREFFLRGNTLPVEYRRGALRRLREGLIAHEPMLLAALHSDLRKPAQEAYAAEIGLVISEIDYALRHLSGWMRGQRRSTPWVVWPAKGSVVARPLGVTLILGPWNYPVQLLLMPLVGAIAAGNCAIVKPSEMAPRSGEAVAKLLAGAFEEGHIACVQGDRSVAEALLRERFEKIFFTGGAAAGRAVAAAAARHLTPVALELGGKCPVIVCADADIRVAARRIMWAKTINAGQSCVAPDYLWVQRSVAARLVEEMKVALGQMFGADPQKSQDFGRIVNHHHWERVVGYLKEGTVAAGGQSDAADLYIAPTLLENISEPAAVLEEEIFGPVLPVMLFDDLARVVEFIRSRPPPLAVYLFSGRRAVCREIGEQIQCGGICVNDLIVQLFAKSLPFGGVGESGMGSYHGKASFDCFSHGQSVLQCSTAVDSSFRYAPARLKPRRFKQILPWLLRG